MNNKLGSLWALAVRGFITIFISVAAVMALVLLCSLAAPRAVHAVAAALVQVVNTAANPAVTQDTSHQASQLVSLGVGYNGSGDSFDSNFLYLQKPDGSPGGIYRVPAGQKFVVTTIRVNPDPAYSTSNIEVMLGAAASSAYPLTPSASYDYLMVTPSTMTEAHPTGSYIPSGMWPIISVRARDNLRFNVGIAVQGYLTAN